MKRDMERANRLAAACPAAKVPPREGLMLGYRKAFVIGLALLAALCVTMTFASIYQYPGPRYIQDR